MKIDIVVRIKQVPDITETKIDPVRNTLIHTGMSSIMNPPDKNTLETGLQLKNRYGGKVTVISMGPPQAKAVLREALVMGAGEAYLVVDRASGGSDTYAISYILSQAVKKLGGFDVILGDEQAIDGNTEQTAPSIAEHLGVVELTYVLNMEIKGGKVVARRQVEGDVEVIEASLPMLCTATKEGNKPRYATIKGVPNSLKTKAGEITLASLLDFDTTKMGLRGSPTKVKATSTPKRSTNCMNVEGNNPTETAGTLIGRLTEAKVL